MHISCGEKSCGDWRSGKENAAHLGHHQYHTGRWHGGITLIPCRCLKMQGVNTKSETSCTANDTTRQVEKHVFGKDIRRMSDQSPFGRKSTPLVISRAFAVVFSRMRFKIRCPVL
jgi:hypothetical protein